MRVFVTGASGFLGRAVTEALVARGDAVVGLSRRGQGPRGAETVTGDPARPGEWRAALADCDAVVHLAGEPVAGKRWTDEHKAAVRASRRDGTRGVVAAMAAASRPRVLVSASGIDYYPFDETDRGYTEEDGAAATFLAEVCRDWEAEALRAAEHGTRAAVLRIGVVLGRGEGAMARLAPLFRRFAGGPIGSGRQWMSWVHVEDVAGAVLRALDGDLAGPVNVVAGNARQADFARTLGDVLKRPSWLPVPAIALRLAVGELAEYLLHGRRVVPAALEKVGHAWRHPDLAGALAASV
jgi:uncharacterized protein (TIGR01777 family)